MRMHPLAAFDAELGSVLTTTAPALDKDNANGAWGTILAELDAVRVNDGSSRYYFGVVNPNYSSGVAGIGYVGRETALGWDKSGADQVAATSGGTTGDGATPPAAAPGIDASYRTPAARSGGTASSRRRHAQTANLEGRHGLLQQRVDQ